MRTLILCGGKGTRAYPHTAELPKPLLEVAGQPILEHLMYIYARQGFTDFVLAGGFMLELLQQFAGTLPSAWSVEVVDTGLDANTGSRVQQCVPRMGSTFFATYGDGLGNVDLHALLAFHNSHRGTATMTTVPLPSQYGTISLGDDGSVLRFKEKPIIPDHLINAGFFVFGNDAFPRDRGEDLERDVLPSLAAERQLFAYRHAGFWKSMDTYKDALDLSALCTKGNPPWTTTPDHVSS